MKLNIRKLILIFSLIGLSFIIFLFMNDKPKKKKHVSSLVSSSDNIIESSSNSFMDSEYIETYITENLTKFKDNMENRIYLLQSSGVFVYVIDENKALLHIDTSKVKPEKFYLVQGASDLSVLDYDSRASEVEPINDEEVQKTSNIPDIKQEP
ncbi:MAG: hypothetical protein SFU98_07815 [Leptospiraceae bacterium]|nr:hypothetical protein [Leptospiraceae bacterium]